MADNDKRAGASLAYSLREKRRRRDDRDDRDDRDEEAAAEAAAAERNRLMRAVTAVVVVLGVVAAGLAGSYVPEVRQPIHMPPRVDWKTHSEDLRERGLFIRYYRMGEAQFEKLASLLRPWLERDDDFARRRTMYGAISVQIRIAIALRILAGGSYMDAAMVFGVAVSSTYAILWEVIDAINNTPAVGPFFFSQTEEECKRAASQWQAKSLNGVFDGVVAAVDGLFIKAIAPTARDTLNVLAYYSGSKSGYGINVQATCTAAASCTAAGQATTRFFIATLSFLFFFLPILHGVTACEPVARGPTPLEELMAEDRSFHSLPRGSPRRHLRFGADGLSMSCSCAALARVDKLRGGSRLPARSRLLVGFAHDPLADPCWHPHNSRVTGPPSWRPPFKNIHDPPPPR